MEDFFVTPIVLVIGLGIQFVILRAFTPTEARLLTLSFWGHVISGFAQIFVYTYYYGSGDMTAYRDFGIPLADALRYDFSGVFPEMFKLLLQQESRLPFENPMGGGSTGSMTAMSAFLLFLLGNSFYGVTISIAIAAFVSKVMIYRALSPEFAEDQKRSVMIAVLLMPTAVFWSCGLLKEPIVMIFMGPLFLGLRFIINGGSRILRGTLLMALGAIGVALFKAYVLLSFGVAASLWLIWARVIRDRGSMAVKPLYLVIGAVMGMVLFTVADRYLLKKSEAGISQSMASQRRLSGQVEGDSNFTLESETDANQETSLVAELLLAPFALMTALFRPFIFEARKAMQFLNALETTWVLWATIRVFRVNGVGVLISKVTASPTLMFCLVFTLILALGTGLSTSNLGALSRYRAPMMPFFALLLLTLAPRRSPVLAQLRTSATST